MPITTGLYIIKNIKQTNIAALADPNDGSPLAANARSYGDDEKVRRYLFRLTARN